MLKIKFKSRSILSHWEWREKECIVRNMEEFQERCKCPWIKGEFQILSIEMVNA